MTRQYRAATPVLASHSALVREESRDLGAVRAAMREHRGAVREQEGAVVREQRSSSEGAEESSGSRGAEFIQRAVRDVFLASASNRRERIVSTLRGHNYPWLDWINSSHSLISTSAERR